MNATQTHQPKRKVLLVYKSLQRKWMAIVGALICALFIVFFAVNSILAQKAIEQAGLNPKEVESIISSYQGLLNLTGLILAFIGLGIVYIFGPKTTNRIAGPVYSAIKYLEEVGQSNKEIKEFKLRDKDHFPELAQAINKAVARLKQR